LTFAWLVIVSARSLNAEIGMDVRVCRSHVGMAEPERDDGDVHLRLQQGHGAAEA
jgi:hypothetical protein